jgi:hypothetical protein
MCAWRIKTNLTFRNIIIYIYMYNPLSTVLLKHNEMEYVLKLHGHTIDIHCAVCTLYNICSYCYFLIYAWVVLSSRSTYDYNLRQFTIDRLAVGYYRKMFFACPYIVYYKSFPSTSLQFCPVGTDFNFQKIRLQFSRKFYNIFKYYKNTFRNSSILGPPLR